MYNKLLVFLFILIANSIYGQTNLWKIEPLKLDNPVLDVQVDLEELRESLQQTSFYDLLILKSKSKKNIAFPNPSGEIEYYDVFRTHVMHPNLEAKYPLIQTFMGLSQKNPGKRIYFHLSHKQFAGYIKSTEEESIFINQVKGDNYHCFYKSDYQKDPNTDYSFSCGLSSDNDEIANTSLPNSNKSSAGDCLLRKYRLALACTGEYAQFHGGNKPDVMDAMVTAMVRVNGVYEMDLGITMELIPNNDDIIFLNSNTDPYTNDEGFTMLGQNQITIDDIIGQNNYDIGHVFSTAGGGIANLRSPCRAGSKARGVTGQGAPIGDPFTIDYVSHEMGHQFGGNHTFNNICSNNPNNSPRNDLTAVEPGSASTIMGYAGICSPNVQSNSDDHFHAINIEEITNYTVNGLGNSCPTIMNTMNTGPEVAIENDSYTLPIDTPFRLSASGTDVDEDDVLTYCWEQMDNEIANMPPSPVNTGGPSFRSNSPVVSPIRYFPNILSIVNNFPETWEVLPLVSRDMNFRCTVRDNHPLNGCTTEANVELTFTESAGPFEVTSQNSLETWFAFSSQTVTWDVAGTDVAPISCDSVDILLSLDGGLTYDITVLESVPNNGVAVINVPNVETTTARLMVICSDNVFFDINNRNIEIVPTSFTLFASNESVETCDADVATFTFDFAPLPGFSEEVTYSIPNLPTNAIATFTPETSTEAGEVLLTISNLNNTDSGVYNLEITATATTQTYVSIVTLGIFTSNIESPELSTPANGETGIGIRPSFDWNVSGNVFGYNLEIANNLVFGDSIIYTKPDYAPGSPIDVNLKRNTIYYWRLQARNNCATDTIISEIFKFQTGKEQCELIEDISGSVIISSSAAGNYSSLLNVQNNIEISRVKVNTDISHNFIGDITYNLTRTNGTEVSLMNRPGFPNSEFGCSGDDAQITFSDEAIQSYADLENTCDIGSTFAIQGEYQPNDPLSIFTGQNANGIWFLNIIDSKSGDGGTFNAFSIDVCSLVSSEGLVDLSSDTLFIVENTAESIPQTLLAVVDPTPEVVKYIVNQSPENGQLQLIDGNGILKNIDLGSTFTQEDINDGRLTYLSFQVGDATDFFLFDVINSNDIWSINNRFDIKIRSISSSTSDQKLNLDLTIQPNPSNGIYVLNFDSPIQSILKYSLTTIQGKQIQKGTFETGSNIKTLNIIDHPDGLYMLNVKNEKGEQNTFRLVKQ